MLRVILLLAFLCSGGAGLVYEFVWSRYLTLFVGHSAEAQVLVIGMFLGGMSIGALAAGERSRRLKRPLLAYAGIELALAGVGLTFHTAFRVLTDFSYDALFPALGSGLSIVLAKWTLAGLMVFLPSILLGATFPLMAAGVIRAFPRRPGGTIAALYFVNSLGGAIAILLAGFVLLAAFGLAGTSASGAVLNLTAAVGVLVVARRVDRAAEEPREDAVTGEHAEADPLHAPAVAPHQEPGPADGLPSRARTIWRLLLATSALTAVASFAYEIGWIRMLSLVMGSATHSFELMLSAFILGLALGALAIRRQADRTRRPLALLGVIQVAMGLLALATLPLYVASFGWMGDLVNQLPETDAGYRTFNIARYGVALLIMLPATALAGMTLPLITATLLRVGTGERSIGWVYATNTAGAIVGVMAAGLIVLPSIGLKGLLVAGAALDMALGVVLLRAAGRGLLVRSGGSTGRASQAALPGWLSPAAAGVAALALVAAAIGLHFDRALLTSGVYRYGRVDPATQPILYYADGRTATIGVHVEGPDTLVVLTSNGKPDASLTSRWIRAASEPVAPEPIRYQDESTQMLAALVTAAHSRGGEGAVIGHGSGVSGHLLLADPRLESLVTIEIEPRIVDASYVYYPANRRVFDDPRSRVVIADAKSYFAYSGVQYDLILSEPSNPWVSGTASLFSVEFYERIRAYLTPHGVFGQWFHFYEMSDELVTSVLVALHQSFPAYRAYLVGDSDMLIVATIAPELPPPDWALFEDPDLLAELAHIPPIRRHHLEGLKVFERGDLDPLLRDREDGNSDYRPVLDLGAERTRFLGSFADGVDGLAADRFRIAAALGGWRLAPAPEPGAPIPGLKPLVDRDRAANARPAANERSAGATQSGETDPQDGVLIRFGLVPPPAVSTNPRVWPDWLGSFLATEARLHAGSAGYADPEFYEAVHEALALAEPPALVRSTVTFMEGLAAWDFAAAAAASREILAAGSGEGDDGRWSAPPVLDALSPALLLDGAVTAALVVGDVELAELAFRRLAPLSERAESDFRLRLLEAHIDARRSQPASTIRNDTTGVSSGSG